MKSIWIIPVLVSILILGTLGFSPVQADNETPGLVATFGDNTDPIDGTFCNTFDGTANAACGAGTPINHFYKDVAESKADTIANTNSASLPGGYFDAVEKTAQNTAVFPVPDKTIMMYAAGDCFGLNPGMSDLCSPMNFVRGYEEATFTFDGLTPFAKYEVEVLISDLDDFGLFEDMALMMALPETVFVTGNTVDLGTVVAVVGGGNTQFITKTLPTLAIANGAGDLTLGFNENFQWDHSTPSLWDAFGVFCTPAKATVGGGGIPTPFCNPSQTGVRVEQISLTLSVPISGTSIPIDTSALLLAGVSSVSMWMIPVVIAGVGIGVFVIKRRS